mmetsp:Transcript_26356/g.102838  ORF Transcript_26356/g.102838 Transcript_26356/m.102838 type:complete len:89 (-) Transcript_26356:599-865(-)
MLLLPRSTRFGLKTNTTLMRTSKKQLQKTEEKDTWLCIGKESFLKLSKEKAIDELRKQSLALWAEIEQTQEVVTIKKGQLDDLVEVEE